MDSVVEVAEVIVRETWIKRQIEEELDRKLSHLSPGSPVSIWFKLKESLSQEDLDQIATGLAQYFDGVDVIDAPPKLWLTLTVPMETGIASPAWWAPLMLIIPAALILGIISWGVMTGMPKLMEAVGRAIVPLGLAAILASLIYFGVKARK